MECFRNVPTCTEKVNDVIVFAICNCGNMDGSLAESMWEMTWIRDITLQNTFCFQVPVSKCYIYNLQLYRVWKLGNIGFRNYINRFLSFSRLTDVFAEPFALMCGSMGWHSFHTLHFELKGFSSFSSWMLRTNFNNYFEISFSHLVGWPAPR